MSRLRLLSSAVRESDRRAFVFSSGAYALSDSAFLVATLVAAHDVGGVQAVGLAGFVRVAPAAVLAPFASAFADHYGKRFMLSLAYLVRVLLILVTAAFFWRRAPLGLSLIPVALVGVMSSVVRPAQWSMPSDLARSPEEVTPIMVAWSTLEGFGTVIGPALAGFLLGAASSPVALLMSACGAGLAWILLLGVPKVAAPARPKSGADFKHGLRTAIREPRPRLLLGLFAGQTFTRGLLNVLIVVASISLLGLGKSGAGYLSAALGVGGLIGGAVAVLFVGKTHLGVRFAGSLFLWGAPIALIGLLPHPAVAAAMVGLVGLGNTLVDVSGLTLLQRVAPPYAIARVFGVLEGLVFLGASLGSLICPLLVTKFGIGPAHLIAGLLLPVLAVVSVGSLKKMDEQVRVPRLRLILVGNIDLFADLPLNTLTTLCIRMRELRPAPGEDVVTQGEPGDSLFVIAEGEVDVVRDGQLVATLGPGDYFGEIALLQHIPRVATVKAREGALLLSLDRSDFLGTVLSTPGGVSAAAKAAEERLGDASSS